jgi:Metallo-beta-lactamase superfamily
MTPGAVRPGQFEPLHFFPSVSDVTPRGQTRTQVTAAGLFSDILPRNRLDVSTMPSAEYDSLTTITERVMRKTQLFILMSVIASAWPLSSYTATSPTSAAAETPRITILYDAFGKDAAMSKDWGYAALVEINGKRILFDTGNDPAIFAKNVKAKGVDLTKLDFVVLSHRHTDHVSGVSYLLSTNPKVKIYAPADGLGGTFGYDAPSNVNANLLS